ncbi:MAG: hypothetical protein EPO40_04030 [Myxococcaceae bacterium]|nr:MAG: hypothetical protein EPO40_04030 [Myxococcaceae bacterium]
MSHDDATSPVAPVKSRRRWVLAFVALIAVPLALFGALVILLGLRMRSASALARGFCAEFTVGAPAADAAVARRARELGLQVYESPLDSGRSRIEARSGVLTATYLCAIEVQDARVTSSRYVQED